MTDTIVLEILGRMYRAEYVGECLRLVDLKASSMGYIMVTRSGEQFTVTRVLLGLTDPKVFACHHCDNRWCVNVDHLYAGDAQSNMDDRSRRGRASGRAALPAWQKNEMFELDQAYGPSAAARCVGKHDSTICHARRTFFR